MKEHPIPYCDEMVRAILDGRKTQTRRIAKLDSRMMESEEADWCPYGGPGDLLYVKENAWIWCEKRANGLTKTGRRKWRYTPIGKHAVYRSDNLCPVKPLDDDPTHCWRLKVARFMPRWASRITLELISVRAERLQDINEEDAKAEGVESLAVYVGRDGSPGPMVRSYAELWNRLNEKRGFGWDFNPWVWRLEFRRIKP